MFFTGFFYSYKNTILLRCIKALLIVYDQPRCDIWWLTNLPWVDGNTRHWVLTLSHATNCKCITCKTIKWREWTRRVCGSATYIVITSRLRKTFEELIGLIGTNSSLNKHINRKQILKSSHDGWKTGVTTVKCKLICFWRKPTKIN